MNKDWIIFSVMIMVMAFFITQKFVITPEENKRKNIACKKFCKENNVTFLGIKNNNCYCEFEKRIFFNNTFPEINTEELDKMGWSKC